PSDTPPNSLLSLRIASLPAAGTLALSGTPVTVGQEIPAASISGGLLTFTPVGNANGAPYTSFTFQLRDNGGTANSGIDLDPSPNTVSITVNAVNDPPSGIDSSVTTARDTAVALTSLQF